MNKIFGKDQIVFGIEIDHLPKNYRIRKSATNNLRIHFHYSENFKAYSFWQKIKKTILEPAKRELENIVKIKFPVQGILRVDRHCIGSSYSLLKNKIRVCTEGCENVTKCLGIPIPEQFLKKCRFLSSNEEIIDSGISGSGIINSDLVLIVEYISCPKTTAASSNSCFLESQFDRPILGVLKLCSEIFIADHNIQENIKIIQHEIIHTLGFAVNKYAFYHYSNGDPIIPRDIFGRPNLGLDPIYNYNLWNGKIIKKVRRKRESVNKFYFKDIHAFVLENVVKVAREHFGCPSIDAVDIEDTGDTQSAYSHFDEYFLFNDIMTPLTNGALDVISKFTLALLQDTGWYEVDYSKAGQLDYAKNSGCLLPLNGCFSFMKHQKQKKASLEPFCDKIYEHGNIARCSENRKYFDFCHLERHKNVSLEFQYFHNLPEIPDSEVKYYAGISEFNEFCPTKAIFINPNSICHDVNNGNYIDSHSAVNSYYGNDSLCFEHDIENYLGNRFYGASCLKYSYDFDKSELKIFIGSNYFICPSKKTFYFLINTLNVSFKCPNNFEKFIKTTEISIFKKILCILIVVFIALFVLGFLLKTKNIFK